MKILDFGEYEKKRKRNDMCVEIVNEIHEARRNNKKYTVEEMKDLAERFLQHIEYDGKESVPIIKIVRECGFEVVWGAMKERELSGFVSIDKRNSERYDSDKIIGVNGDDEIGHQRFVIAHEFAHYLFDYEMNDKPYFDTYIKNSHKTIKEQIANAFATNILMPAKYFALSFDEKRNMEQNIEHWGKHFEVQKKSVEKRVIEVIVSGI